MAHRLGESADMYDTTTGAWKGVVDGAGRETFVPTLATDPLTGGVTGLVGPNGGIVFAENARPTVIANTKTAFDIFDLYKVGDRRPMSLPNPYSAIGPDLVHPSCVFLPRGWRGWRYWMAYTPYPLANSDYENPCIAVSNDGENWTTPAGLVNPLAGKPVGGYNADTHLVIDPGYSKMYLVYRERIIGGINSLKVMESVDGVTWTSPITILSGVVGVQDYASASLFFDTANSRWVCISHNLDGGATYPMQRTVTSGTSIYSGWGASSTISITNPTGGRTFWHSCFDVLPDGRVVGLIQDIVNGGAGAPGALFAAESLDGGLTFAVKLIYSPTSYYRTAFHLAANDLGQVGLVMWVGIQSGTFSIAREDWAVGDAAKQIEDGLVYSTALGTYPSTWLWWDNFNRADGAVGSPLLGSAATVDAGTFTIVSNTVRSGSAGNNRSLITLTTPNHSIEADIVLSPSTATWLIFRAVDANNFYRLGLTGGFGGPLTIQSIVGGGVVLNRAVVAPLSGSATISQRTRIRVVCRGRRFRVYVNGVFWEEISDLIYSVTGLSVGFQSTNAGVAFDNFLVTT